MIDIDALLELEAKATPCNWMVLHDGHGFDSSIIMDHNCGQLMRTTSYGLMREDSLLVIAMRSSIRELCLEVKALRDCAETLQWYAIADYGNHINPPNHIDWDKGAKAKVAMRKLNEARRG
jgi:hypothetical protein